MSSNILRDFLEWMKDDSMATNAKNNYVTFRDITEWISGAQLPDIRIEHQIWTDEILIINTKTFITLKISRFEIEASKTPRIMIINAIAQTMQKSPTEVAQMIEESSKQGKVTSAVYTPGGVLSAGGGGGAGGIGFGQITRGAMGSMSISNTYDPYKQTIPPNYHPNGMIMHDMPELEAELEDKEKQLQRDLVRNRLFSEAERFELEAVKKNIISLFNDGRLNEEKAIPFKLNKLVIAGGCFASLLNREPVRDIDVFLLDDDYNRVLANGMAESYRSDEPVTVFSQPPRGILQGSVAGSANTVAGSISLAPKKNKRVRIGNSNYMENNQIEQTIFFELSQMQYITTKYKTREELVKHFDFKHCCVSYDFATDKLYITREVYDLIKSKKLVQNSDRIPAGWRFDKFQERGWKHEPLDVMFL